VNIHETGKAVHSFRECGYHARMSYITDRSATAFSVSELNRQAKSLLESSFFQIRVQGELSSLARPSSGHWYFTLKDDRSQIRCAMFRNRNMAVRFQPKEGDLVTLMGKVSLYEGRGDYQFIAEAMDNDGEGQLQRQFEILKAKLANEGLFEAQHKKPIPKPPKCLGVITSPTGAAIHDILTVLKRRYPSLPVLIYPALVQGAEAPRQLRKALQTAIHHDQVDLIILGRGGGSLEDLWAFNDEQLAYDIFNCPIPIISAVGHEVDFSISDWVADLRAPTPSAAAELISPDQDALRYQLDRLGARLERSLHHSLRQRSDRLNAIKRRLRHPGERLKDQQRQLLHLKTRLDKSVSWQITGKQHRLNKLESRLARHQPAERLTAMAARIDQLNRRLDQAKTNKINMLEYALRDKVTRLQALNPLSTLERGYAIVQNEQQAVLTNAMDAKPGDTVINTLSKGQLVCTVQEVHAERGSLKTTYTPEDSDKPNDTEQRG
jgi:exodeoxyribonuclease VII large subunit